MTATARSAAVVLGVLALVASVVYLGLRPAPPPARSTCSTVRQINAQLGIRTQPPGC